MTFGAPRRRRRRGHDRAGGRLPGQILHQPQMDLRPGRPGDPRPQRRAAGATVRRGGAGGFDGKAHDAGEPVTLDCADRSAAIAGNIMPEYQLYCFAQSGNAYRAALMLNLIGADWKPIYVDFFQGGETRTPKYRAEVNEMGEVPVLVHGAKKLTPVRRDPDLSRRALRQVQAGRRGRAARGAALDHLRQSEGQRLSRALSVPEELRQAARRSGGDGVPQRPHRRQSRHRRQAPRRPRRSCSASGRPSPTCRSCAYLYYPAEEFGFDIAGTHKNIGAWLDRIKALPGWKHPYDLMPGHPLQLDDCDVQRAVRPPSMTNSAPVTKRGFVGQQIDAEVGDLRRRAEAAERDVAHDRARAPCRAPRSGSSRRIDHRPFQEGRMDRVAAHLRIEPRAMQRDRLGEQPHAALGGVVGGKIVPADQARDRRQVDDRAAAALEQRQRVLAAEKRAVEIDGEDLPPGREVGVLDGAERRRVPRR